MRDLEYIPSISICLLKSAALSSRYHPALEVGVSDSGGCCMPGQNVLKGAVARPRKVEGLLVYFLGGLGGICPALKSTFCSPKKFGVPTLVTHGSQGQPTSKMKGQKSRRTNRIPSSGGGESLCITAWIRARYDVIEAVVAGAIQPGFRKPRGGSPFERRKSLSSEIMPATVCTLVVSWKHGDGRHRVGRRGQETHWCRSR